jgi:hypothetical protein
MTAHITTSVHLRKKPLLPLYEQLKEYKRQPDVGASELCKILDTLDEYTGHPDIWHNLSTTASMFRIPDAELRIVCYGLDEHPGDVDLLCDKLQLSYTTYYSPEEAQELWQKLGNCPDAKFNWRYWVFGSLYHTRILNEVGKALELLDEGLQYVKRSSMQDIIRNYRLVLMDNQPLTDLNSVEAIAEYQRKIVRIIEEKYLLGLELGVEDSYTLAIQLARLYQEQAFQKGIGKAVGTDYLTKAMDCLEAAERLYTGSENHQITNAYIMKARILMAQRQYGDALRIMRSLPGNVVSDDPSMKLMLKYAALMVGEELGEKVETSDATPDTQMSDNLRIHQILEQVLANESVLLQFAQRNPSIAQTLVSVASKITGE